jgi:hypothetical protein
MRLAPVLASCALLAACSPQARQPAYTTDLDMAELMHHVIDPAAFMLWRGAGTEVTEAGERDLSPTTEEGWKTVEDGAAMVAEAGNLLLLPGRAREPEAEWNRLSKLMSQRALEAKAAVEKRDKQAVFDTGGRLYEVCQECHRKYIIEPQEAGQAKQ